VTKQLENDIDDAVVVDGHSENLTDMQDDIDAELQSVFAEFGGDPLDTKLEIKIKKVEPKTGKTAHCFNAVPSELPLTERIKDEYGPGIYEIWVYKNGYRHKKQELRIASQQKKPLDKVMAENKQDVAVIVSTMMEQQRESMRQLQDMLTRQQTVSPAPASDPVGMMSAMMAAMVQMKDFLQPAQSGDNMNMFLKGLELAKDFVGGGAEKNFNDTLVTLAKEFGPPLLNMATKEQKTKIDTQLHKPAQPTGSSQPQLTGTQPMTETTDPNAAAFKMQVDMLVSQAGAGKDVGIYADLIADNVPAEQIQAFITRSDMIEYLTQFNPQVPQYREWFENLRGELQEILTVDVPEPDKDITKEGLTDIADNDISVENNDLGSETETVIESDAVTLHSELTQDT
jgi:hypothetical protein